MALNISDRYSLRFQIDPARGETLRACSAIVRASLPPSRANGLVGLVYAAVILAAYFLTPATRATTIVIGVGAALATVAVLQAEGRSRLRLLQENDPHARETHFVELGDEGVHTWCAHLDARYPWAEMTKIAEDKEFVLFVRGSGSGAAIPKRLLDGSRDAELRRRVAGWAPGLGAALGATHVEPDLPAI